jgi:ADP-ribosyl-[dinitrogen reductase] hydrolase
MPARESKLTGSLMGMMAGDALGLPFERLSARRGKRLRRHPLGHQLLFGHGMISDDTEHAAMTAAALLKSGGNRERFRKHLAWQLRWWLITIPPGAGQATLKACCRLWIGVHPGASGVRSAGNGAAMRCLILGAYFSDQPELLEQYVSISTLMTHTDPRALKGSLALARAAAVAANRDAQDFQAHEIWEAITPLFGSDDNEIVTALQICRRAVEERWDPERYLAAVGLDHCGATGYIYHTLPAVLFSWLSSPADFTQCIERALDLGNDTDTTAALAGGLCATLTGPSGVPANYLRRMLDFPRSARYMRKLGAALEHSAETSEIVNPPLLLWPLLPLRNIFLIAVLLIHVVRRALPPY